MTTSFHPATRIVFWVALVVCSQLARGPVLWGFGLFVLAAALVLAPERARRLLKRVRILMLVLVILFAFFTPGEALIPSVGQAGPTLEGVALAAQHITRLAVVAMLVAILLARTGEQALVAGLMVLAAPLKPLGLSVERLAVRILLVFRYVEMPPAGGWRALLDEPGDAAPAEPLLVTQARLHGRDWLAISGLVAAMFLGASL